MSLNLLLQKTCCTPSGQLPWPLRVLLGVVWLLLVAMLLILLVFQFSVIYGAVNRHRVNTSSDYPDYDMSSWKGTVLGKVEPDFVPPSQSQSSWPVQTSTSVKQPQPSHQPPLQLSPVEPPTRPQIKRYPQLISVPDENEYGRVYARPPIDHRRIHNRPSFPQHAMTPRMNRVRMRPVPGPFFPQFQNGYGSSQTGYTYRGYIEKQARRFPIMMYTLVQCVPCQRAKHLLAVSYSDVAAHFLEIVGNEDWQRQLQVDLIQMTGQETFPYIFICGEHVGGSSDLFGLHQNGQLRTMLNNCQGPPGRGKK